MPATDYNSINKGADKEELLRLAVRLLEDARMVAGDAEHPVRVRLSLCELIPCEVEK